MSEPAGGHIGTGFVDVYGTARRLGLAASQQHPDGGDHMEPLEPFWLRGLKGELPLWMAFWIGFVFGHGIVLAISFGAVIIGTVFGLVLDPTRLDDSMVVAAMVLGIVGTVMASFVLWSVISVWRSARNAEQLKWAIVARTIVGLYAVVWGMALWHLVS